MDSAVCEYQAASVKCEPAGDGIVLRIKGRLDAACGERAWRESLRAARGKGAKRLVVDLTEVDYCDTTGVGLIFELRRIQEKHGREFAVEGESAEVRKLMEMFDPGRIEARPEKAEPEAGPLRELIDIPLEVWRGAIGGTAFLGELSLGLAAAIARPRRVRWDDAILTAQRSGADALPIIALIGFIMGLVMAFQAAIPMRRLGMEIYVADMVSMVMIREMGALTTAILLAGRTGSAFAAELGTMKINEEIDALKTMGLDPTRFLVIPRVIAATVMTPVLSVFTILFGLLGGALVMDSLDYPAVTYWNRVQNAVELDQGLGGLFKALVFGFIVAAVGCRRGMRTQTGPSAVGESTTSATVTAIILIVAADGIFAVVFYYLGI